MTPIDFDPTKLNDFEGTQKALISVLNLVEKVKQENDQLQKTIQKLRDEVSRLRNGDLFNPQTSICHSREGGNPLLKKMNACLHRHDNFRV